MNVAKNNVAAIADPTSKSTCLMAMVKSDTTSVTTNIATIWFGSTSQFFLFKKRSFFGFQPNSSSIGLGFSGNCFAIFLVIAFCVDTLLFSIFFSSRLRSAICKYFFLVISPVSGAFCLANKSECFTTLFAISAGVFRVPFTFLFYTKHQVSYTMRVW